MSSFLEGVNAKKKKRVKISALGAFALLLMVSTVAVAQVSDVAANYATSVTANFAYIMIHRGNTYKTAEISDLYDETKAIFGK